MLFFYRLILAKNVKEKSHLNVVESRKTHAGIFKYTTKTANGN